MKCVAPSYLHTFHFIDDMELFSGQLKFSLCDFFKNIFRNNCANKTHKTSERLQYLMTGSVTRIYLLLNIKQDQLCLGVVSENNMLRPFTKIIETFS